jgi:hypothetical protein
MPDLICPPISDSCRPVRVGVDLLTMCGYSALYAPVFFDKPLSAVVGHVLRGDIPLADQPFIWAGCAVVGLLSLVHGLHRIRTEGHGLKPLSFLWSAGVIAAVAWLLWLGFPATDSGWHFMRMLLVAWAASNASNIVLQLSEVWRRRPRLRRQYPQAQTMQGASRLLHRRTVTTAWVEEIEQSSWQDGHEQGWNDALLEFERQNHVGHDGQPVQIVYVKDEETGEFVPVQPDRVRVSRRRH